MAGHNDTYWREEKRLHDLVENPQQKDNLEHLVVDGKVMLNTVISGFSRSVVQIFALLRYCAAQSDNSLPTFRVKLSVLSSRAKEFLFDP